MYGNDLIMYVHNIFVLEPFCIQLNDDTSHSLDVKRDQNH